MELYNPDQGRYFLAMDVLNDGDVSSFTCEIDGKKVTIPYSNQGHYAIYLGQFHKCVFEENTNYTLTLQKENSKFKEAIEAYSLSILQGLDAKTTTDELYQDLPEEPTERIYQVFKRLLSLTKTAVLEKDASLKEWILEEVSTHIKQVYHGKSNYVGNWWVYEIGISRCLNEMLFLLYNDLTKEDICKVLAIENFYLPQAEYEYYRRNYPNINRIKTDYANLSDNIYICLLRSILLEDEEGIKKLSTLLPQILKITDKGNGFYPDGSFLYHSIVPYNASYGEVLLHSVTKIIELFYLLKIDIENLLDVLYERIEISYLPFLYHQRALECVRGRSSSRTADCHYSFNRILESLKRLSKCFARPGFLDKIFNEEEIFYYPTGIFVYNYMNRYIKRNSDYLIAISSCSNTVANYESINNENLLGSFQANFTYELYYNTKPKELEMLKVNPFFRNGSTNSLALEPANQVMQNQIATGVSYKDILNTCFHQKNDVEGYFSKFILKNSLVSVGSNIHSLVDYVSTIISFEENASLNRNALETKEAKIIFAEKPRIEQVTETRSFYELNKNEKDIPVQFKQTRVYYKNPKEYHYQIYPKKACIQDEYELKLLPNAHIIKYENYILINSFDENPIEYEGIILQGKGSFIFVIYTQVIDVYFASNEHEKIYLEIKDTAYESSDIAWKENEVILPDKLEHKIKYRRKI